MIPTLDIYAKLLAEWTKEHTNLEFSWEPVLSDINNGFIQISFWIASYPPCQVRRYQVAHGWVTRGGVLYIGVAKEVSASFECDLKDPNCLTILGEWIRNAMPRPLRSIQCWALPIIIKDKENNK